MYIGDYKGVHSYTRGIWNSRKREWKTEMEILAR